MFFHAKLSPQNTGIRYKSSSEGVRSQVNPFRSCCPQAVAMSRLFCEVPALNWRRAGHYRRKWRAAGRSGARRAQSNVVRVNVPCRRCWRRWRAFLFRRQQFSLEPKEKPRRAAKEEKPQRNLEAQRMPFVVSASRWNDGIGVLCRRLPCSPQREFKASPEVLSRYVGLNNFLGFDSP